MVEITNKQAAATQVVVGLLTGVEGAHFFSARLPSKMTIRKFVENEEDRKNIISAIWESIGLSMGLGALVSGVSYIAKVPYWWIPVAINGGITIAMASLYWNDIRTVIEEGYEVEKQEGINVGGVKDYGG